MSKDDILEWFQRKLNRQPEAYDVYLVGKEFYQLGSYSRAMACLQYHVSMPGASIPGRHLLGYCYLNLHDNERALREFKKCVKDGFQDDWQLIVELIYEIDEKINASANDNYDAS
ncbi:hypothetical protein HK099_007818 [Clydaea vesicula]|uniref:Uncharacterized protein n=1 Tax=Clydaea vesicula TaxID=447962 RepID=A0AAD5Y419_9FUNG|nr:hypothetical protein HK099_007818 [Clydaea vesicula]KAJ3396638.1 hypothetical protein HDU92_002264 [Lobulomyces angularis]